MRSLNFYIVSPLVLLLVVGSLLSDDPNHDKAPFVQPTKERLIAYRDSQQISVRLANRFHLAVIGRLIDKMPRDLGLAVDYGGIVRFDNGRDTNRRIHGSFGLPLSWDFYDKSNSVLFTLVITPEKRASTNAVCRIGKRVVFVDVFDAFGQIKPGKKQLEKKRKELGGRSVLEVVKLLESKPSELELPFPLTIEEYKKLIKQSEEAKKSKTKK